MARLPSRTKATGCRALRLLHQTVRIAPRMKSKQKNTSLVTPCQQPSHFLFCLIQYNSKRKGTGRCSAISWGWSALLRRRRHHFRCYFSHPRRTNTPNFFTKVWISPAQDRQCPVRHVRSAFPLLPPFPPDLWYVYYASSRPEPNQCGLLTKPTGHGRNARLMVISLTFEVSTKLCV